MRTPRTNLEQPSHEISVMKTSPLQCPVKNVIILPISTVSFEHEFMCNFTIVLHGNTIRKVAGIHASDVWMC